MAKKFKILSIDGGGIRGVFPAQYLANLEARLWDEGKSGKLFEHFDLICGTSTGGIIALGLALGIPASEMVSLYENNRKKIFQRFGNMLIRRKHSRKNLEKLIRKKYRDALDGVNDPRLDDLKTRVCITGYDIVNAAPKVYKTPHKECYHVDKHRFAYQVALSTGAAPTYFSPYSGEYEKMDGISKETIPLTVDGGVFSNNPTLIGIIEATSGLGVPIEDLEVISLGTGAEVYSENNARTFLWVPIPRLWGRFYWINKVRILNLMMQSQSQHVHNMVSVMSGGTGENKTEIFPYHRVQTTLDKNSEIPMDTRDKRKLETLKNRANSVFQNNGSIITNLVTGTPRWGYEKK